MAQFFGLGRKATTWLLWHWLTCTRNADATSTQGRCSTGSSRPRSSPTPPSSLQQRSMASGGVHSLCSMR
uniref:Secreted protein n=1 Tax=Arundo donax TaxID=35708 RepID=A0A0A9A0E6_ARUDO